VLLVFLISAVTIDGLPFQELAFLGLVLMSGGAPPILALLDGCTWFVFLRFDAAPVQDCTLLGDVCCSLSESCQEMFKSSEEYRLGNPRPWMLSTLLFRVNAGLAGGIVLQRHEELSSRDHGNDDGVVRVCLRSGFRR
jgi:hypothetical protein